MFAQAIRNDKCYFDTLINSFRKFEVVKSYKKFNSIINENTHYLNSRTNQLRSFCYSKNKKIITYNNEILNKTSLKRYSRRVLIDESTISNLIDKKSEFYQNLVIILSNSITNRYNGIVLNLDEVLYKLKFSRSDDSFDKTLKELLSIWVNKEPKSSITVKIPKEHIYLTEAFLKNNFYMHHCTKNEITMCLWLDKRMEDKIPKYCHTLVGTGSLIFTKENKIILIREKYSNYNTIKWKFITGLNDPLESIFDTCKREAKEETNLLIDYHGVISFSEFYPTIYNTNEFCFFNLCSINKIEEEIKKDVIIDTNELETIDFFNKEKVKELLYNKQTTVFTEKVLNKVLPFWDEFKTLEDNIQFMINNRLILTPIGHEEEMNNRFKSFKFYN